MPDVSLAQAIATRVQRVMLAGSVDRPWCDQLMTHNPQSAGPRAVGAQAVSTAVPQDTTAERVHSYDLYRGLLLVAMVIYHVLLNLTSLPIQVAYARWIPMGFVMFLGVILARFLQSQTRKKLLLALKLIGAFVILNIPRYLESTFTWHAFLTGDARYISFEILLPMGLVTLLAVPFDRLRRYSYLLAGLTYAAIVAVNLVGYHANNLQFLLYGFIGYFVALSVDLDTIAHKRAAWSTVVPATAVVCLPFVLLGLGHYFDFLFVIQIFGLYLLAARWVRANKLMEFVGRNSFVIYVGHIVVIRALMYAIFDK